MTEHTTASPVVLEGDGVAISALAFGPGGRRLVAGTGEGSVVVWEAGSGHRVRRLEGLHDPIGSVAVSNSTVVAAVAATDTGRVWAWDVESGEARQRYRNDAPVACAALSGDGHRCITIYPDHIQSWGVPPAAGDPPIRSFTVPTGHPAAAAVTPDGHLVAIGSREGELRVIDLARASAGAHVDCGEWVHAVALSPDGRLVLSADDDCTVRVWDAMSGDHLRALQGHDRPVTGLAVDGGGRTIVSIAGDDTLRLWNLADGELRATVRSPHPLTAVAITPDGDVVAVADEPGAAYVLPVPWLLAGERDLGTLEVVAGEEPIPDAGEMLRRLAAGGRAIAGIAMAEARDRYRRGEYDTALQALDELGEPISDLPLYVVFRGYVAAIIAGGGSPRAATPSGEFADVDAMHFFLVREEIARAREHVDAERFPASEEAADEALQHAPHFPFANFLKAAAIHNDIASRAAGDDEVPLAAAVPRLESALACARMAATDPDIGDAGTLVAVITDELDLLRGLAGRARDVEAFNALAREFEELFEAIRGGVGRSEAARYRDRLADLGMRAMLLLQEMTDAEGKQAVQQLLEAIGGVMAGLS